MTIKEILFTETDYSCALCGEKRAKSLTEHHIDGNRKNNEYDNKIVLCHNCQHSTHSKPVLYTDEEIRTKKKFLIGKTLTQYGINALKLSSRNKFRIVALPFLLYHLVSMGYMKKEEEQMGYSLDDGSTEVTARFVITDKGKKLCEKWFRGL